VNDEDEQARQALPRDSEDAPVRRTVAASALATVLGSIPVFLLGGLAVLVRDELAFGEVGLGFAVSLFFTVAALSAIPAGRVAHHWGPGLSTATGVVVSAIALIGMATAQSFKALLVALAVAGAGNAMAQVGSNEALARTVPPQRQGLAFGVKQSAVPAATMLAGLALPVIGLTAGWRIAFGSAALLALVYLAVAPRTQRPTPAATSRRKPGLDATISPMLVVACAAACAAGAASACSSFLVESAVSGGTTPTMAGVFLAGGSGVAVVVRLLVGVRANDRHLQVIGTMLAGGACGMALLATGNSVALAVGTGMAFGLGWGWPGLMNFAVIRLNPSAPATATGINQTGVFGGAAAGPLAFGILVEGFGYRTAWLAAAGSLLAAAVLLSAARRMLERARSGE
jgi:predicted MFS family arabinose efflux permease